MAAPEDGDTVGVRQVEEDGVAGTSGPPLTPAVASPLLQPTSPASLLHALRAAGGVLYRFSRPHTMLGTTVSILSVSALALTPATAAHPAAARAVLTALAAALLMNVCIVGVNQVFDVAIDAVNKPGLPLPAGELGVRHAAAICVACAAASLSLGAAWGTPALQVTLAGSLALGLAYSVDAPGLRWKRHPALAAGCILAVRAVGVQAGFFSHVRSALAAAGLEGGGEAAAAAAKTSLTPSPPPLPPALGFAVAAMLVFSIAIALLKDTPDVEGDAGTGVRTLPVRAGAAAVFRGTAGALLACYALAAGWTLAACTTPLTRAIAAGGHAAAGLALGRVAARTDASDKKSLSAAYMSLWALFYLEYLLIPFVR